MLYPKLHKAVLFLLTFGGTSNSLEITWENVAGNGVATESTNIQNASNAVDGNEETSSETDYEISPWWKLDLRKEYPIYAITVTGPQHEYTKISLKNEVNNTVECQKKMYTADLRTFTFTCDGFNAHYVTVEKENDSRIRPDVIIHELKISTVPLGNDTDLLLYVKASQSSTFDALRNAAQALSAVHGASAGGDFCLNSCSFTSSQWEPRWWLDLYLEYTIISVSLTARNDQHALRLFGAKLKLADKKDIIVADANIQLMPGVEQTFNCTCVARFITVQIQNRSDYLAVCDFKLQVS
uniref:uncharacterized protein isoform X2 n=1 Tax=Myxine glutinosa TaxID=7769 RepID=UPI00358EC287